MPVVIIINYFLQERYRPLFLILSSLIFYAYNDMDLTSNFVLFILITYLFSFILTKSQYNPILFGAGIICMILYLLYFKYLNFFVDSINAFTQASLTISTQIIFPLGVSFFTFSSISYLIDTYRTRKNTSFLSYVHYITFFPKLVSGPIVRIGDFNHAEIGLSDLSVGISRFIVGLAKKTIFAYYFGITADSIWKNFQFGIDVPSTWIGAIAYSLQIYYDFSGYSDMAIGLSRMLGYRLPENFNFPYLSKSITEYWRRWHLTLGSWFGRYVYIPLGGSRKGNVYFNLFIVFLVSGLWHGANWTFIAWGLWHAVFRLLEQRLEPTDFYKKVPGIIKWLVTMIILLFSRVIFRSIDIEQAFRFLGIMLGFGKFPEESITFSWQYFLNNRLIFFSILGIYGATLFSSSRFYSWWSSLETSEQPFNNMLQTLILAGLAVFCIMMILSSDYMPFIYFRF